MSAAQIVKEVASNEKIAKNYIYNVIYQILVLLAPIATAPYLARTLGAEMLGVSNYVATVASIFAIIALAQKLSNGIPFVRVDFYSVNGKIYFGELTFFPDSGFGRFTNSYQDAEMGSWLDLSKVKATC